MATVCASYAVEMMNKVRKALTIGGPTFIHSLDPCPKGWDYDPMLSPRAGRAGRRDRHLPALRGRGRRSCGTTARPRRSSRAAPRKPVREYLLKQGRFAHFTEEDLDYFQAKVDEMWDKWEIPGVVPFRRLDAPPRQLSASSSRRAAGRLAGHASAGPGAERRPAPPCCSGHTHRSRQGSGTMRRPTSRGPL